MANVLVMANRTAESPELLEALKERAAKGDAAFTLVIPSTPHGISWAADMSAGEDEAEHHREAFMEELRGEGLDIKDARIGDPDPLAAAQDAVNLGDFDEVIVSTLPLKISKWLKLDMPSKVRAATGLPVTHVVASDAHQR
jgi:hypothetical protein